MSSASSFSSMFIWKASANADWSMPMALDMLPASLVIYEFIAADTCCCIAPANWVTTCDIALCIYVCIAAPSCVCSCEEMACVNAGSSCC